MQGEKLIVEIDGGYHDYVYADDMSRQQEFEAHGWDLMRFSNEDVIEDVEAVAVAIARHLELEPEFGRGLTGAKEKTPSP